MGRLLYRCDLLDRPRSCLCVADESHHLAAPNLEPALADLELSVLEVGPERVVFGLKIPPERLNRVRAVVGAPCRKFGRQNV